ncbi:hypothetical protein CkaCkLH20_08047 [Colletotrichum karsti]|uniref:Ankyrin repeat protein n=1 Tax=Colletotrichum karsti TaxID=1095194 RepID=A0A9P6LFT5_9PEZI|nr:uncharacterized protein CkaCkLH20_08047 [Colletotrichum karsti]KAF9874484.1 hypothetical protein CkaCkLH20_08047 [Colletotrichum karsti]
MVSEPATKTPIIKDHDGRINGRFIAWLLSSGLSPNTSIIGDRGSQSTPLLQATCNLRVEAVCQLLEAGADPNLVGVDQKAPALMALVSLNSLCESEKLKLVDIAKRLLSAGASLHENDDQESILMQSIKYGHLGLLKTLLQHGANVLHRIPSKPDQVEPYHGHHSVMWYAVQSSEEAEAMETICTLIHHAKLTWPSSSTSDFVTMDVVMATAAYGYDHIFEMLYSICPGIVKLEHNGFPALHAATRARQTETCRLLLRLGALVDGPVHPDLPPPPLFIAWFNDDADTAALLYQSGANKSQRYATYLAQNNWCKTSDFSYYLLLNKWEKILWEETAHFDASWQAYKIHVISGQVEVTGRWASLAQQGKKVPPRSFFRNVRSKNIEALRQALRARVDPNWIRKGITVLHDSMIPREYVEEGFWLITEKKICKKMATVLLDAGAILTGGEAQRAILLDDWDFARLILRQQTSMSETTQSPPYMSLLEAAVLADRAYTLFSVLSYTGERYDAGALCTSVLLQATGEDDCDVEHLLSIRPQHTTPSPLEGLAIGIAALYDDWELLELLLDKIQTPALARLPNEPDARSSYGLSLYNPETLKHRLEAALKNSFRSAISFWRSVDQGSLDGSPLVMALWSPTSLSRLLKHGYRPDKLTISAAVIQENTDVIKQLAELDLQNTSHPFVEGPVSLAVEKEMPNIVRVLLDAGYDVNESNYCVTYGRTPLQSAVERKNLALIDLLLDAGARVNEPAAKDRGATALQVAASNGRLGLVKHLVDRGADINAPGAMKSGRTALETAAENGGIDVIQYLLSNGAQTTGKQGQLQYLRAYKYAVEEGRLAAADLLKSHRRWTAEDEALWSRLEKMSKSSCSELESNEEGSPGELQHPDNDGVSAASAAGTELANELEELEIMTKNPLDFWSP